MQAARNLRRRGEDLGFENTGSLRPEISSSQFPPPRPAPQEAGPSSSGIAFLGTCPWPNLRVRRQQCKGFPQQNQARAKTSQALLACSSACSCNKPCGSIAEVINVFLALKMDVRHEQKPRFKCIIVISLCFLPSTTTPNLQNVYFTIRYYSIHYYAIL